MTRRDVQNEAGGVDVADQSLGAGGFDSLQVIGEHGGEDLDHLPVAAGKSFQLAPHASDRDRQIPFLEWRAVAKGAGFAGQYGDVMQRIVDGPAAAEGAIVAPHDPAILPAFQSAGTGAELDRTAGRASTGYLLLSKRAGQVLDTDAGTAWKPSNGPA